MELPTADTPAFYVGKIPIYGRVVLSPMDGVSDWPFRAIARRLGSAISYPEFVNAMDVVHYHDDVDVKLAFKDEERPLFIQLFDDEPDRLVKAALCLQEKFHPDAFDINMGCPSRAVSGRGAGAGLLRTPEIVAEIFEKMVRAVSVPVTGKIRLGWDERSLNYMQIAHIVEDCGGSMLAVHGRTKSQGYAGQANWESIAEIKQALHIPVIGNGDVRTPQDIQRMLAQTGCDGVMIGRAAIENPWILAGKQRSQVTLEEVRALVFDHLAKMNEFYGERGTVLFRKFIKLYLKPYGIQHYRINALLTEDDPAVARRMLEKLLNELSQGINP